MQIKLSEVKQADTRRLGRKGLDDLLTSIESRRLFQVRFRIEDDDETVHSITVMVDGSDIDDDQIVAEARRKVDRIMQHWGASRPA